MANPVGWLVDQFKKRLSPPEVRVLHEEIAAPGSSSGRPPFVGHLAFDIDPRRLGAIIRAADNGQTRDWHIVAEELEELYTHYASVLSKRKRQVVLLPITVEAAPGPDGEHHADFVRDWLDTKVLQRAMFDIADGIGKGWSVSEIMWDSQPGRVRPAEIIWRNQRDFEVSWEDGQTIWLRDQAQFLPLAPHKFLLHKHQYKSGSPIRSSLSRAVAWKWMYATFTEKDWQLFVQGYGLPVRLGRYGPEASDSDKRTLWRAVRQIAGDLAAIIPKSMEVEFVEAKAATEGAKLFLERSNWLNFEVSKIVLGSVAGTDAVNGSHAVGQEHRSAEQDVEKFDAELLADTINRQLVPTMIAFTFGPQNAYPTIKIGQKELAPISDVIAAAADLGPLGFKLRAQDVYDRLQLTKPEAGDEVIGAPTPVPGATNPDGSPIAAADLKVKANPHPEINPNSDARAMMGAQLFGRLIAPQSAGTGQLMAALEERLARQAGDALGAMTAQVRACLDGAESLEDFAARLGKLQLDSQTFATAMMQGMTLAHLTGQASLLDELK